MAELRWRGLGGHLCVAPWCCFHLNTEINARYRVSTVGCYHGEIAARERSDKNRIEVGLGRMYETMVFELNDWTMVKSWTEIDANGYNDPADAERGHVAMVSKWADVADQEI
jgi:hypothetical protein